MSSQTGVLRRWKPYLQKFAQNIIHVQNCSENRKEERRERERERKRLGASGQIALHMHESEASGMREYFTPLA